MVRGSVQVGLPEDDHPDVGVQVDLARLGTGKPANIRGDTFIKMHAFDLMILK